MSDETFLRAYVIDALKPKLPKRWKWFDYSTGVDEITDPTVILTLDSVARMRESPRSHRLVSYTLTLIDPSTAADQRENTLDDAAMDLLNAIDAHELLQWETAQRGMDKNGQHLGFDITITYPVNKIAPLTLEKK